MLKAQSDAGPRIPENVNRFGRTKEIKVETPPNTVRCQFEVFGEKFVWIPGGAETGWLELPKSLNSQIAHLPKLNVFPPISESDFVDVDTYIRETRAAEEKKRKRGVVVPIHSQKF